MADLGTMFGAPDVDTFLGLSGATGGTVPPTSAIIGAPCATPYASVGPYCAGAPKAIRDAMAPYAANIGHVDFDLGDTIFPGNVVSAIDLGDVPFDPAIPEQNRMRIRESVRSILDSGAMPVVLGGDDSVPIPVFDAYNGRGSFTIVQIDAHIDWRDDVDGERLGLSSNMRRASEMPHVERIIQVGQRGLGSGRPQDHHDALEWGVEFVSAGQVAAFGIEPVLDLIEPDSKVLFTLDIDGLDPSIVPGVIGRAPGGLDYWQTVELLHGVAAAADLCGFNVVEYMPDVDVDGLGALVAARLVVHALALGARRRR